MKKKGFKKVLFICVCMSIMFAGSAVAIAALPPVPEIPFSEYTIDSLGGSHTWEVAVSNTSPVKPKMDVVYVMDTTGSMSGYRTILANTVNQFNADLEAAGASDIYWGAAFFGDMYIDNPWYGMSLPLGEYPLSTVSSAIATLHSTGGGDAPEDACAAYMKAIAETEWREDAQHVVVLITDIDTKYADYRDTAFNTRSTTLYGGYNITDAGAAALTAEYNVKACLLTRGSQRLYSMANALGVTERTWQNAAQLQSALEVTVIAPFPEIVLYEAKVESCAYTSDGAESYDVLVEISPNSEGILLEPGESKAFTVTVTGSLEPSRFGDSTMIEIGYYAKGIRVDSATQYIEYIPEVEVSFTDWDNTPLADTQRILYGLGALAPDDPTRTGYTFIGWDKDFSCVREDLTVTALYEINVYTVSFYKQSQDGNNKIAKTPFATQQVTYNELIDFTQISVGKNAVWYYTDGITYGAKFNINTPVSDDLMLAVKDQNNNQQ